MIDLVAFDTQGAPQTPLPQIDFPPGMKVYPWPDNPDDWWEVTYRFYLPPYPPEENKQYYLAVSSYDLAGNESALSNVINFPINPPGRPGEAELDGYEPEVMGDKGNAGIIFEVFREGNSNNSNVPRNLTIQSIKE